MICKHCGIGVHDVPTMGLIHDDSGMALCAVEDTQDDEGNPIPRTRAEE